jgi:ATP-binding cassette, subfamily B, multidrug efflux pump
LIEDEAVLNVGCQTMTNGHDRGKKLNDRRLTARLLRYLWPHKWSITLAGTLTILNAPLASAGPLLTKAAIDLFLVPDPARPPSGYVLWLKQGADWAGFAGRHRGLLFIAILFLLNNIAYAATQYFQNVITENTGQKAIHDVRHEIFSHLQKVPISFYDRNPVGQLMSRLTTDVNALSEMFNSGMVTILGHGVMALYIAAWMFRINESLAIISFAIFFSMMVFMACFRRITRPAFRRLRHRMSAINGFLQEHLTGMSVVQLFNREQKEMQRFECINTEYWESSATVTLWNAVFYSAIEVLSLIGVGLILWFGGGQVFSRIISMGSLVAFIQLAQSFYDPVVEISSRYHVLQSALASSERIFMLLDEPVAVSPENPLCLSPVHGRIEFRNVWFAYQDSDWVLKNVSFIVEPGEKVAFVGRTGSGKTTITNLLLRFYEIQHGQILLDGIDIRQIHPEELRSHFAIVPQEIFLFSGDIISNICLRNQSISENKMRMAAHQARVDEFVSKMESGYKSEIFEQGAGLSVGQKQLVGFARALALDRSILILDEATSSIDVQTEVQIRDVINTTMAGRTALVVAHRLSTVRTVDKILVMQKGEIREEGNHRSLMAQRGIYWKLCQLQFGLDPKAIAVESMRDD